MGVTGLLQQLKEIQEPTTLDSYRGQTLAVDTYGWLHRGLILCAQELCKDAPTASYVTLVMKKVDMLRHFGVEPYLVFDGAALPTKEGTLIERREKRERAREAAAALEKKGDRRGAWKEYMKAAAVTPEMAKSVMVELDRRRVKYVVAPYEADPQMVYLEQIGAVDAILLEDSDLLVFGCRRLVTKLSDSGGCVEINRARFSQVRAVPRLADYTPAQWRAVAILSGCDYTKGVPGVGLKTAFAAVLRTPSLHKIVLSYIEKGTVPPSFLQEAVRADLAFQFQKVFDPRARALRTLNEYPPDFEVETEILEAVCGRTLEEKIHVGICTGRIHPFTHTVLVSREQNLVLMKSRSVVDGQMGHMARKVLGLGTLAQKTQSCGALAPKTIESYFRVLQPTTRDNKTAGPKEVQKKETSKRKVAVGGANEKLSPTSKKLKRISTAPSGGSSRFFSQPHAPVPNLKQTPSLPFLTGDSEVPETLSPIKKDEQYLTDEDLDLDELADHNVGYTNTLEDSPVKLARIGRSWRERFLATSTTEGANATRILTLDISSTRVSTGRISVQRSSNSTKDKVSEYDTASSLGPPTPRAEPVSSQFKSLQRDEISESDDEPRGSLKLLRFAFSGL